VRAAVVILLALVFCLRLDARPWPRPRAPQLIDPATFERLIRDVRSEPFTDGKLGRLRNVAGGGVYVFAGGQVISLLDAFTFWDDRLQALRLLPLVDADNALIVCHYFEQAPELVRSAAARILGLAR
jgi:hypothetical protein